MSDDRPIALPGSFLTTPPISSGSITKNATPTIIDKENTLRFQNKQFIIQKTRHQQHIISQLDTLVYFLIGYQFIKYCHSACILPVLCHLIIQKALSCSAITGDSSGTGIRVISDITEEVTSRRSREELITTICAKTCALVYWKAIFTCLYHVLFVSAWMMLIVDENEIGLLRHGTWWFISFIGESTPDDINNTTNYWYRLFQLGLPGLLASDLIILFIQLVLFQCIFKQSTVSPIGRRLNEDEVNLIRQTGDYSSIPDNISVLEETVPWVLQVKLYELFKWESFTLNL